MYDTARRVGLVKKRVREMTRRKRRRGIYGLSAVCMLLFAAMIEAAGLVIAQGETAAQGIFGAMLLRRDAGGYVLLGTVSFAAAVVRVSLPQLKTAHRPVKREKGATPSGGSPF